MRKCVCWYNMYYNSKVTLRCSGSAIHGCMYKVTDDVRFCQWQLIWAILSDDTSIWISGHFPDSWIHSLFDILPLISWQRFTNMGCWLVRWSMLGWVFNWVSVHIPISITIAMHSGRMAGHTRYRYFVYYPYRYFIACSGVSLTRVGKLKVQVV